MARQVPNNALGTLVEVLRKWDFSLHNHFENFERVVIHERTATHHKLVYEYAQSIPVHWLSMSLIHNDFRCKVFWGATDSISSLTLLNSLDKPKI